jgi:outer membrane protein assembly factor BamE (lipoprotein component of BamABCDE complex)
MNQSKSVKRAFNALITAAVVSLSACGGGDSGSPTAGDLPAGKIGTVGDGVNAAEFEAIQCGMNKDQVTAIVGDTPTNNLGDLIWSYTYGGNNSGILFTNANGVVKGKNTGPDGKPAKVIIQC